MSTTQFHPETVAEIEAAFYAAVARADVEAVMALWANDETVVCIHPGAPRLVGHASIRASWESIFEQGGVQIRPVQLHATRNAETAVHSIIEEVHRSGTQRPDIHILATNVYMKTARGWRMVAHHASVVPGEAPPDEPAASMLH
ncbi:MAG TPA: nuclear transport factor 2 family protein [Noviherbaspirillum sp.]|nr:nuclear transport factor 2 family protein [Noviherbaspirillum sp.]